MGLLVHDKSATYVNTKRPNTPACRVESTSKPRKPLSKRGRLLGRNSEGTSLLTIAIGPIIKHVGTVFAGG
jgi:hypothetical protein